MLMVSLSTRILILRLRFIMFRDHSMLFPPLCCFHPLIWIARTGLPLQPVLSHAESKANSCSVSASLRGALREGSHVSGPAEGHPLAGPVRHQHDGRRPAAAARRLPPRVPCRRLKRQRGLAVHGGGPLQVSPVCWSAVQANPPPQGTE